MARKSETSGSFCGLISALCSLLITIRLTDWSLVNRLVADGAKWIWEEARLNLVGSMGVLEIYHALEAVSATLKKPFGEGTAAAHSWTNRMRTTILECGWAGFDECWQATRSRFRERRPQIAALDELRNYPGNHVSHMNYAERLQEGGSIGSGQIEGACKNLNGRRLKQTAAR